MNVNKLIDILTDLKNNGYGEYDVFLPDEDSDGYSQIVAIGSFPENKCLYCSDPDFRHYADVYEAQRFFKDSLLDISKVKGIILTN